METLTIGNLRQTIYAPDEPIPGYKMKTWVPPVEWGPGIIMGESKLQPRSPRRSSGDERFLSGRGPSADACALQGMAVPFEIIYFDRVDKWVNRLIRSVHGYDKPERTPQPTFNDDDLCAVPV